MIVKQVSSVPPGTAIQRQGRLTPCTPGLQARAAGKARVPAGPQPACGVKPNALTIQVPGYSESATRAPTIRPADGELHLWSPATKDAAGKDAAGKNAAGRDAAGRDATSRGAAGRDAAGKNAAGRDSAGRDTAGRDPTGRFPRRRAGLEPPESRGQRAGGSSRTEPQAAHERPPTAGLG